jgi:DNA topoisomerase I
MDRKTLIIVESPAKSQTISKYLGSDYVVSSSMGHVRDLPPKVLGIDLKANYKPCYEVLADKRKVIQELKRLARRSQAIMLASDPDREGEAIAYHLQELLREDNDNISRILFNEITRGSILEAVQQPKAIDMHKVDSQQMRRLLDRLAGYKISPVLQRKIGGPLSAGRVQSIALKLIVEREKEIRAFLPEEYWTVAIRVEGSQPPPFLSRLEKYRDKALTIPDGDHCQRVLDDLKQGSYELARIAKKRRKRKAPPPLITSSLQQEAFRRFKFPVRRTMKLAQELYEGLSLGGEEATGLITYMRTDSFRVSAQAAEAARDFVRERFGPAFLPATPPVYKSKAKIQDAHECIRPSFPFHPPDTVKKDLNPAQFRVYQLIWDRFFASQMIEAQVEETQFDIRNGDYLFVTKGEVVVFEGFLKVLKPAIDKSESDAAEETEQAVLPALQEGETLRLHNLDSKQNFTKPPARYSEASLVKVLEEKGIGRPSTYAKIIDTLNKREYVLVEEKRFLPTELGIRVVDYLEENFADIMNYSFTAELEKKLDLVSAGEMEWVAGIDEFYGKLEKDLERVKDTKKVDMSVGRACPQCGAALLRKYSHKTRGWFIGCGGYPACTYTERADDRLEPVKSEILDKPCPKCGKPLVKRYSRKTRNYFVGCSGFPACNHIESEPAADLGPCPQCGQPLTKRFSRKTRRYFVGCSGYPTCTFIQRGK